MCTKREEGGRVKQGGQTRAELQINHVLAPGIEPGREGEFITRGTTTSTLSNIHYRDFHRINLHVYIITPFILKSLILLHIIHVLQILDFIKFLRQC